MSSKFVDFFDTNITILKWGGIWIPEKHISQRKKLWYLVYNSFWIIYSVFVFTPAEFIVLNTTAKSLNDLMKNLNMSMTHLLATIKVIIWFRKRNEIINIIETLRNASLAYEPIKNFQPDEIVEKEKKLKNFWTVCFLLSACSVSISACINSMIVLLTDYSNQYIIVNNSTEIVYDQKLPYFSFIPWNYKTDRWRFGCAIIFQFFPVFNFAFIIVGFDTLYTAIVSYMSAHLKILQGAFRTIRSRCVRRLAMVDTPVLHEPKELANEMNKEMHRCIKHLQIIFNLCEKMENIFTYITLVQVLVSLIVFCTCLYLVSSVPIASKRFGIELVYLVAIEIQLALYCYFGNKVTLRGEDMSLALYEGEWLSADEAFKKSMLITMTRMIKPIHLTMGKFSPLTLSTFVTIGRGSYSFFAVLKNSNFQ